MITREFATKWCNDLKFAWDQRISKLELKPIAIDGNRLIVRWFLDYTDVRDDSLAIMDGVYQVDFDECRRCVSFTQWWVIKE